MVIKIWEEKSSFDCGLRFKLPYNKRKLFKILQLCSNFRINRQYIYCKPVKMLLFSLVCNKANSKRSENAQFDIAIPVELRAGEFHTEHILLKDQMAKTSPVTVYLSVPKVYFLFACTLY